MLIGHQLHAKENWDVSLKCFFPSADVTSDLSDVFVKFNTKSKSVQFDPNVIGSQPFSKNLVIQWGDPVISWVSFGLESFDLKTGEFSTRSDIIAIGMFNRETSQLMHHKLTENEFDPFINRNSVLFHSGLYLDNGENGKMMECVAEAPKF